MPLKVSDGIAAWIKDFKKSDAPQFKGKSEKERRDQAIAAYLSAKRGPQKEAATHASADKKPEKYVDAQGKTRVRMVPVKAKQDEEIIRSKKSASKLKRDASSRPSGSQEQKEEFSFKVDIEGLPSLFMTGNSPGSVKSHLRKLVKQPSMVKDVKRVTKHDKKKELRKKSMEEEVPHSRDEGKPGARKHAAKMTPGQVIENRRERLRAKLAAVGKDMEKTNKQLKKTVGIKDKPVSRSSTGDPNYKSPFFKDDKNENFLKKAASYVMGNQPKGASPYKKSQAVKSGQKSLASKMGLGSRYSS